MDGFGVIDQVGSVLRRYMSVYPSIQEYLRRVLEKRVTSMATSAAQRGAVTGAMRLREEDQLTPPGPALPMPMPWAA